MDVVFNALLFGFVVILAGLVEVRCAVYCFVVEFVVWGFGFVGCLRVVWMVVCFGFGVGGLPYLEWLCLLCAVV